MGADRKPVAVSGWVRITDFDVVLANGRNGSKFVRLVKKRPLPTDEKAMLQQGPLSK